MKLKYAFIALAALGGAALSAGIASAMPLAPVGLSQASNVESVRLVCGPRGCVRTVPAYRRGVVVTFTAALIAGTDSNERELFFCRAKRPRVLRKLRQCRAGPLTAGLTKGKEERNVTTLSLTPRQYI
jgi:hypothetical protein